MRTLLCIGAVFSLCGTACAEGLFDPFAGIKEGVLCGDAQEADPHQAQTDGNVVIDSPDVPGMIIDDTIRMEVPDMTDNWIQRPDMLDSIMGLAARPVLVMQGSSKADDAPEPVQPVNLAALSAGDMNGTAVNPFQAAPLNNGDIVIGSPATNSPVTPKESLSLMPEQPQENFIYDLVIPDLCFNMPALADCRNFRPMIRRPVPDAERQTVQGVNLVSPADVD